MKNLKLIAFVLIGFIGISAATVNNDKLYEISKNIEIFVNVYKQLNAEYVDDIDPGKLMRTGIDAMMESLDPYTNYISESQIESYRINTEGKYQGIGAIVKKVGDYVTIIEPYEGSPVLEAGLQAGDQITEVNGKSTKGKSTEDVMLIMRGVPGTKVNLTVKSAADNSTKKVDLSRGEVSIPNVPYSGMVSDNVGYFALTTFTPNAGKNVYSALKKLKKENDDLQGVILDLRDNGGGLLREAISVCNVFIPKGIETVSTKGKVKERDKNYSTMGEPLDIDIPLIVLINKKSASASEIVSGVIQDLDRGVVMGQRSYGKGLVQNTKEIGFNSRVKLTTSKYYIPSGRCIQSVEYENGEPKDIADNQRSKFKTKNGRTVLDGGGVTPDIKLDIGSNPKILEEMQKESVIFQFVSSHLKGKTKPDSLETINFSGFEDFKSFLNSKNFSFKTESEKQIEKLEEAAEKDGLNKAIDNELSQLKQKIAAEKNAALDENKSLITKEIEKQISARYFYQKGKAYQRLNNDNEIQEAITLINDQAKYKNILK